MLKYISGVKEPKGGVAEKRKREESEEILMKAIKKHYETVIWF